MSAVFRRVHHVCLVVDDIEAAIAYYESVGIGPWRQYPPLTEYTDLRVPNDKAFQELRYWVTDVDNLQLQLCEPSEEPSPQRAFLDSHGPGVFHIGFEVDDVAAAEDEATAGLGMEVLMAGRRPDGSGFAYFDTARQAGVILEVRQSPSPEM